MRVLYPSVTASILRRSMPVVTYSSNRPYLSQLPLVDSNTLWCPAASDLDPFLTVNLGNCILLSYLIVYIIIGELKGARYLSFLERVRVNTDITLDIY